MHWKYRRKGIDIELELIQVLLIESDYIILLFTKFSLGMAQSQKYRISGENQNP